MTINNSDALLNFLIDQTQNGQQKNWFGWQQQRLAGVDLAYRLAVSHADKMSPEQIVQFVLDLNSAIYNKILKG